MCVAYWYRLKEPCPSHPGCRDAVVALLHNSSFLQNRIPIFWLVVHLICIITPQLCKAPCSESWEQHLIQGQWFPLIILIFFFPISHTLCMVLCSPCWNWYISPAHFKQNLNIPSAALGEYSSVNDPNCPKGAQKQMCIERKMILSKLFSHGYPSCLVNQHSSFRGFTAGSEEWGPGCSRLWRSGEGRGTH